MASLTQILEDEKSWQGDGQEKMMEMVKEAARLKAQVCVGSGKDAADCGRHPRCL
jgi:hypothetical protein